MNTAVTQEMYAFVQRRLNPALSLDAEVMTDEDIDRRRYEGKILHDVDVALTRNPHAYDVPLWDTVWPWLIAVVVSMLFLALGLIQS